MARLASRLAVNICESTFHDISVDYSLQEVVETFILIARSFAIGYVYSFVAAGVFYYAFNHFFPHTESMMDHAETGEEIIVAQDLKNVEKKRLERDGKKPSIMAKIFSV